MANYILNNDGSLTKSNNTANNKKKKKGNNYILNNDGTLSLNNTIENDTSGYFKSSNAFDDGWQFGDITKTIGGTALDFGANILKGGVGIVEGATDLLGYGASGVASLFGADDVASDIKKATQYNWNDALFDPITGWTDKNSVLGDKTDAVGQGVGYYAGMVALQAVGVPWQVTAGVTSMSGGLTEAFENGASTGDAIKSSLISAAGEIASEYMFSGLGKLKGTGALDDAVVGSLTKGMKQGFIKNLAQFGLKSAGEGVEEIASGYISALGKQWTYMKDKDMKEIYSNKDKWNDFVAGTLVSAISGAGSMVNATYHGRSVMNGLTQNEQNVYDAEVNNRLNKELAKPENKNLSKKRLNEIKTAIEEKTLKDLNKGKVNANTIDEVVGQDKVNVGGRKSDTNLIKSYANEENKGRAFQYKTTGDKTTDYINELAATKGINNSIESHEKVDLAIKLSKELGTDINFTNNAEIINNLKNTRAKELNINVNELSAEEVKNIEELAGKINGNKVGNKITLNLDSNEAGSFIIGHEVKHFMEIEKDLNGYINDLLFKYAEEIGTYKTDYDNTDRVYQKVFQNITDAKVKDAKIKDELTADYIGKFFTDENFVSRLTLEPKKFEKLYSIVKQLYYNATGQKDKALKEKIYNTFTDVYRKYAKEHKGALSYEEIKPIEVKNDTPIKQTTQDEVNLPTEVKQAENTIKIDKKDSVLPIEEVKKENVSTKETNLPTKTKVKNIQSVENIKNKYDSATKIDGSKKTIVLNNGEKLSGTYKLLEAGNVTASHNAETFEPTTDFPTTETGTTVNDRDYRSDKNAQVEVIKKAGNYDGRAFNDNGVIVSKDGVVVSGNDRTMSGELAAKNGTDNAYIEYLKENASQFGFTEEQIESMAHPRVVLELDSDINYDTKTFAMFNKDSKKTKSVTEKAKEIGKTINEEDIMSISNIIDSFDSIDELYNSESATKQLLDVLQIKGILDSTQISEIYNGSKFTGTGKDLVESIVLGSIVNEENIKYFSTNNDLKFKIMKSAPAIIQNKTLGDYSIVDEINNAIDTYKKASSSGKTLAEFTNQYNLFGDNDVDAVTKRIAEIFETKGYKNLRNFIDKYNFMAEAPAKGQTDIFSGGKVQSKEEILRQALNINDETEINVIKYSLAGEKALKTKEEYDREKYAKILAKLGYNNDYIWKVTKGYYYDNKDKHFKHEINDPKFKNMKLEYGKEYKLHEVLDANDIFRAYPEFRDYKLVKKDISNESKTLRGYTDLGTHTIYVSDSITRAEANETLTHEIQHMIQEKEGFAYGSSRFIYKEGFEELGINLDDKRARLFYKLTAGELESKVVEERLKMTPEERQTETPLRTRLRVLEQYAINEKNPNFKHLYTEDNIVKVENLAKKIDEQENQVKYSISDNQGRELTKEQQEYFKDSKVRDEDGNLLEVYHGSPISDITNFDVSKSGENTMSGEYGIYFTDSKQFADDFSYERIETDSMFIDKKGKKGTIYPVYLDIKNPLDFSKLNKEDIDNLYDYGSTLGQLDGKEQFISNMLNWQRIGNHQLMKGDLDLSKLKDAGYDGFIAKLDVKGNEKEYVVFNSNQIKNIDNTNPTTNEDIRYSLSDTDLKEKQNEIIQQTNPMFDDYHAGIRSANDIRTWEEVLKLDDDTEGQFVWGDYTREEAEEALKNNKITIYSSYPIKNGVFVSTSYVQAQEYAGGRGSKVYSKEVPLNNVAWINGDEGQYAKVEKAQYSYDNYDSAIMPTLDYSTMQDLKVQETAEENLPTAENTKGKMVQTALKGFYDKEIGTPTRSEVITKFRELAREKIDNIFDIKDKKKGILYQINTMKRNLRDIMPREKASNMYDTYFKPITEHNAEIERDITSYNERIQRFNLSNEESTYTQMWGELKYNPESQLTEAEVESYYNKNRNKIDKAKSQKAANEFRNIYDDLIGRINETLVNNGYKPIEYRRGYFPHFIEEKATSFIGKIAEKLGWKVKSGTLPTDIAGITDQFKPGKTWTSFSQQRTGDATDYNALKGLDNYLRGAMDVIHHTEDIQKLRALENEIRYQYSAKGIQEKIDQIYADDSLDMEEKNDMIMSLTSGVKNGGLGNFVTELRNYTDNLANKKAFADRSMEQAFGRDTYSLMQNINSRVSANMVGGNIRSAMTNFIPLTQGWGRLSTPSMMSSIGEAIRNEIKNDGFAERSTLLTNRTLQAERLFKTGIDKINDKLSIPFEAIDSFTSNVLVRAKYKDNIKAGMTETEAMNNADEFAKDVLAGRSKGDAPTIMNQKNPLMKLVTAFQLEVNNQYGYMFKDVPTDMGDEAKEKLVMAFVKMFLGAYLYNMLFEKITGNKAAFSPIDMAIDDIKTATNENMDLGDKISAIATDTAKELPFVGGLLGGGRLPIQGAIPYDNPLDMVTSTISDAGALFDEDEAKKKTAINNLVKEWKKPLYYVALPFAGGQIKKTVEGLSMYDENLPIAGSYTSSGKLRFEADNSTAGKVQAALFGQYASENAREYFDNGYTPLTEKQVQEALDSRLNVSDYRAYRQGLKGLETTDEKVDYIYNLPLEDEQKNVLVNNTLNRKEDIDISNYGEYESLAEFDYANSNPNKYAAITQITDFDTFNSYKDDIAEIKKSYTDSESRKQAIRKYINSLSLNQYQKLMVERLAGGYSVKNYRYDLSVYINSLALTREEKEAIDSALFD